MLRLDRNDTRALYSMLLRLSGLGWSETIP